MHFLNNLINYYENPKTTSKNRPLYYGGFINQYVYKLLEDGKILTGLNNVNPPVKNKEELQYRKNRQHQHFKKEIGLPQFRIQMGKILGIMEISPNLRKFKANFERTTANSTLFDN